MKNLEVRAKSKYNLSDEEVKKYFSLMRVVVDDFYALYEKVIHVCCLIDCYYAYDSQYVAACLLDVCDDLCNAANKNRNSIDAYVDYDHEIQGFDKVLEKFRQKMSDWEEGLANE